MARYTLTFGERDRDLVNQQTNEYLAKQQQHQKCGPVMKTSDAQMI